MTLIPVSGCAKNNLPNESGSMFHCQVEQSDREQFLASFLKKSFDGKLTLKSSSIGANASMWGESAVAARSGD